MKNIPASHYYTARLLLLALFCGLFLAAPAMAGQDNHGVPDGELRIIGTLKVDAPVKLVFDLKGYTIPDGSYTSINVGELARPEGERATIRTGYPETNMVFHTPGHYRLLVLLNEVRKPSCGGVEAKLLLERMLDLEILP